MHVHSHEFSSIEMVMKNPDPIQEKNHSLGGTPVLFEHVQQGVYHRLGKLLQALALKYFTHFTHYMRNKQTVLSDIILVQKEHQLRINCL